VARSTFVDVDGVVQPAPAPRFSRTPGELRSPPPGTGEHTESILAECGLNAAEVARLKQAGVVRTG
jgi:alpha-methylacyl-CoA racemase